MASRGGVRGFSQPATNVRMRAAGNSALFMPAQYS